MSQVNPEVQASNDIKQDNNLLNNGAVDADLKSESNILNNPTSEGKVVTEVTSIAAEELRTGVQQQMPTVEELVARANSSYIRNLQGLAALINKRTGKDYAISRKGMNRLLLAIIQLPQDGLPVNLNSHEEKLGFGIGQRCISDRFMLTQHHINEEMKRIKAEREAKKNNNTPAEAEVNKGEKND